MSYQQQIETLNTDLKLKKQESVESVKKFKMLEIQQSDHKLEIQKLQEELAPQITPRN